jgi:hypothetical protein
MSRTPTQPTPIRPPETTTEEDVTVPRMSSSLSHFAPAFVRVQSQLRPVIKNSNNPHFGNDFADLAAILEEALPLLAENGFALMQFPTNEGGKLGLMSMLIHESGQFVSATMPLLLQKQDPQGEGSAITYGRRYAACAILGIRTADDDGNEAAARPPRPTPTVSRKPKAEESPDQWFMDNGWLHRAHHDETRSALGEKLASFPEQVKARFRKWYDDQKAEGAPTWGAPWPEAFAELVVERLVEFSEDPGSTSDSPASPSQDDEKPRAKPKATKSASEAETPAEALKCPWCGLDIHDEAGLPVTWQDTNRFMHSRCKTEWEADSAGDQGRVF